MTPELIAILAVGVALAGLILNGQNQTNRRLDALEQRLEARFDALEQRIAAFERQAPEIRPAGSPTSGTRTARSPARGGPRRTA